MVFDAAGAGVVALARDAALLTVELPEDAMITINGRETKATGSLRRFLTKGLEEGQKYDFVVSVLGGEQTITKTVTLAAGQRETVSFLADDGSAVVATASAPVRTSVRLRVPVDAKVWIQGRPTVSTGEIREFTTTKLDRGQSWNDYEIRVVTIVNNRERVAIRHVTLSAGDALDLAIDPGQQPAAETTAAK